MGYNVLTSVANELNHTALDVVRNGGDLVAATAGSPEAVTAVLVGGGAYAGYKRYKK